MFYTSSSQTKKAYQLKWFGSVIDNKYLLAVYEVQGGVVEILTDTKGKYLKSKIATDEHI